MSQPLLRQALHEEFHARPYLRLGRNLRVFHFAYQSTGADTAEEWAYLTDWVREIGCEDIPASPQKFFVAVAPALTVRFEKHTEFTSLSLIYPDALAPEPSLFDRAWLENLPRERILGFPGEILVACWIDMVPGGLEFTQSAIAEIFGHDNFAGSFAAEGGAQVFMSFKLDDSAFLESGFSRILVQNTALAGRRTGRLLQRLTEIETYRSFALLSLPMVREETQALTDLEDRLAAISLALAETNEGGELEAALDRLSRASAEIESVAARTSYRLAATKAYNTLIDRRIEALGETRFRNFQTIAEFHDRCVAPGIRTCAALDRLLQAELRPRPAFHRATPGGCRPGHGAVAVVRHPRLPPSGEAGSRRVTAAASVQAGFSPSIMMR
jgi:uncharacterized membrane-anchored protein